MHRLRFHPARFTRPTWRRAVPPLASLAALTVLTTVAACGPASSKPATGAATGPAETAAPRGTPHPPGPAAATPPKPAHTVIVLMENSSYGQIIGNPAAPFINSLAQRGALFTNSRGVAHPSEPNYLALFSGSTQGVTDDSCPHTFSAPNLATGLLAAHDSFAGYSEGLPQTGSEACTDGEYARKHVPWTDFSNVPASASKPFTAFPAGNLAHLPAVSFVIPNLCSDMHDCSVGTGDAWLRSHIGAYANWAMSQHSLLVVTWDENDGGPGNQIPTIFLGEQVRPGHYSDPVTHYSVLRTIEDAYRLLQDGRAASAQPITNVWKPGRPRQRGEGRGG